MKRFFTKTLKPTAESKSATSLQLETPEASEASSTNAATPMPSALTTGLQPKFTVPPLPHPCPHEHIALLATSKGLLLRPHIKHGTRPESHVRISWGREGKVEEINNSGDGDGADWSDCVVVYGIIGILNLFNASHLLVITHRTEVGTLFDPRYAIYAIKSIAVVPLMEDRARESLGVLRTRNHKHHRPSLAPPESLVSGRGSVEDAAVLARTEERSDTPRVKFASEDQVKVMSPLSAHGFESQQEEADPKRSPSPSPSVISTPSSEMSVNTGNIAKILTDRLSFWNRMPRAKLGLQPTSIDRPVSQDELGQPNHHKHKSGEHMSLDEMMKRGDQNPVDVLDTILAASAPPPQTTEQKNSELEDKIIRECMNQFGKGDITRSLQQKQELLAKTQKQHALLTDLNAIDEPHKSPNAAEGRTSVLAEPSPTLPLWRRVDRQFWWNEWLSKPFVDAGLHTYVLPIMQGFFQIATFPVPREPEASEDGDAATVDYILVSRRSRDRAGLRYQRRGIDDDANVANFVETETIMRVEREGFQNVFSHIQIRGSIPLFWSQPGYSLKPIPVLSADRSHGQNLDALRRHFQRITPRYGPLTVVNLAEQYGKEGVVTAAYREYVKELDMKEVRYLEYDFHMETKGMKYENISNFIEQLQRTFESQGYLWISNDFIMSQQKGAFRVNCIDCLDRTNVVESAFARHVLNRQLESVALQYPSGVSKREIDVVFNDVWANNGDAISREYAGTSALKGDFTRTGKRDLGGLLNDGVNSLARMYSSTFGDWFSQAVIDYMLGNRTISVFSEFLIRLQSTDPRDLIRISRIRAEAIAECVSRVLSEGERLLSGWTLFSPSEVNTKVGEKFEEKVLLLSVRALYIISYDYTLEKVKMYTRVPLGDIIEITKGAYILSPLEEGSRDPLQNAGFIVKWHNNSQDTRVTSYSIRNSIDLSSPPTSPRSPISPRSPTSPRTHHGHGRKHSGQLSRRDTQLSRILSHVAAPVLDSNVTFAAFKALPIDPARSRRDNGSFFEPADELTGASNCKEAVDMMVDVIHKACADTGNGSSGLIKEGDVVSLTEAQKMTSVYAKMEYGVKRLLWLGG